jgi:hypothetical protein
VDVVGDQFQATPQGKNRFSKAAQFAEGFTKQVTTSAVAVHDFPLPLQDAEGVLGHPQFEVAFRLAARAQQSISEYRGHAFILMTTCAEDSEKFARIAKRAVRKVHEKRNEEFY